MLKRGLRAVMATLCRFTDKRPKTTFATKGIFMGWSAVLLGYVNIKLAKPLWWQDDFRSWLAEHPLIVVGMLGWPLCTSFLMSWISDLFDGYRKYHTMTAESWHTFVKLLNDVVGEKTKRFGEFARKMPAGTKRAEAFMSITQPDSQIEHLVRNLRQLLVHLTGDHTLRVVLVPIEKDVPQPNPIFEPKNAVPPADLFGRDAKRTLFCKCAAARCAIVIPDIAQELGRKGKRRRYVASTISEDSYGSIMCQPLIHPYCNQVLFCLSVKSDHKEIITENFRQKHLFMVDSFAERVLLEASLGMIRKGAEE
jgi:hypothetical protein